MSMPIVYPVHKQTSRTSGTLPGNQTVTWYQLNQTLKTAKTLLSQEYRNYLQADLDGNSTAKQTAVVAMNTLLMNYASSTSASFGGSVRIYLLNNQSRIRAASETSAVGNEEYGRTEIIVSQQQRRRIANCIRTSSTTTAFTYYGGVAMGAFAKDCEYPAHVLKIALTFEQDQ